MQPEFVDPIKRSTVKTFTASNKPLKLKAHSKVIELKENSNLFALCALVKYIKIIDIRAVIGEHKLTNASLNLFSPDGGLMKSDVGKSSAFNEVLKFLYTKSLTHVPHDFPVCCIVGGMSFVNKLNPKPTWVKRAADLAAAFNMPIDTHKNDATVVIVTFDCFIEVSLKQVTRTKGLHVNFIYPTRTILAK